MLESRDNPYVKHLRKLKEDAHYRQERQKVFIEGKNLIQELLPFVESGTLYTKNDFETSLSKVQISEAVEKKLASFEGSDLFAEFPLPQLQLPKKCTHILALDAVSDPGNLGTLLRSALALGWDGVFFLPGCADPFNGKVLRASKGALFKLPYLKGSWEELEKIATDQELPLLAADMEGRKPNRQKGILILGNEGQGLSQKASRLEKIAIPMPGNMESLNVSAAGAILMYVMGQHD